MATTTTNNLEEKKEKTKTFPLFPFLLCCSFSIRPKTGGDLFWTIKEKQQPSGCWLHCDTQPRDARDIILHMSCWRNRRRKMSTIVDLIYYYNCKVSGIIICTHMSLWKRVREKAAGENNHGKHFINTRFLSRRSIADKRRRRNSVEIP